MKPQPPAASHDDAGIVAMVLGYAVFAALWIAACNWIIGRLLDDPAQAAIADAVMDGIFIALTALLLYLLMRRRAADAHAKAMLNASEQRFRDMVNTTNGIVWEADAVTFELGFVSDKAERLLGYPAGEYMRPGFWVEHIHPEDRDWVPAYFVSCMQRQQPFDVEYRFIAKDGRTVWLQSMVTVVVEDGAPRWLRGIMVDITERKNAELIRQEDRKAFRDLLGSMIDGYWRTDIRGNLLDVNPTYCHQSGYSREELLGMKIHDLEARETSPQTDDHIQEIKNRGYDRFETMHRRKDQSVWHVEVTTSYRDIGTGEFFVFLRDISERKRDEAELKHHRDHLEKLVNSRTEQLRAISAQLTMTEERERRALAQELHDNLSQLLAVIKIKLASLPADSDKPSIDQVVELVDQADRSARSIAMQLSPPVLHSLGLIPALEWLADQMARDYGLTVHVYSDLCGKVFGDEANAVLFRCLRELLINVAKHAGVGVANVSCLCHDKTLMLSVSDEGCGFDASNPLAAASRGHVFGLSSLSERIASIRGTINIDSSPGNGTTITMIVPCPVEKKEDRVDPDYSL